MLRINCSNLNSGKFSNLCYCFKFKLNFAFLKEKKRMHESYYLTNASQEYNKATVFSKELKEINGFLLKRFNDL